MAFVQLCKPGAPVVLGSFASSISMQSGAPTFGTPEPSLVIYGAAQLARRLGLPFRSGGGATRRVRSVIRRSITSARPTTEQRIKGQIGQPAACMIDNNGWPLWVLKSFGRAASPRSGGV